MERFRPLFGCPVDRKGVTPACLEEAGLVPRYLPDEFEPFDEMEFLTPLDGRKSLVLSIALEEGMIQRVLFGWVGPDDPEDMMRPLDEDALEGVLREKGDALKMFLQSITS